MAIGNSAQMEKMVMQKRRINVSSKRQITIPLQFYKELGIDSEVECFVKDGALIIKPVQDLSGGTFAVEILKDLVNQGYEGEKLVTKFQEVNGKVRTAVENMIKEADRIGKSLQDDGNAKIAEIFEPEV
jgi:bifunctional DNA-binding transcriptional regulator/antitoxin component of YhaV-PrlF toxin-antitoxin module